MNDDNSSNKTNEETANQLIKECIKNRSSLLDLSGLGLEDIPNALVENISKLNTHITHLKIGRNKIVDITPLKGLTNLQIFDANHNHIIDISTLRHLVNLTELSIFNNRIEYIDSLSALKKLQILLIVRNNISGIKPITQLANLFSVYAYGNNIESLAGIENLKNLEIIYLQDNRINDVQPLKALILHNPKIHIKIDNNPFTNAVNQYFNDKWSANHYSILKTYLTSFDKKETKTPEEIMAEACKRIDSCLVSNSKELDLRSLSLTELPVYLKEKSKELNQQITKILLCSNHLTDIEYLADFTNLKELHISFNNINNLAPLAELLKLQKLIAHNNQIQDLSALKNLSKLHTLHLHRNQITEITTLANLAELKELYLYSNRITEIGSLKKLLGLESLNLHNNRIINIKPISKLTKLYSLIAYENLIEDIEAIGELHNIIELDLFGNYIKSLAVFLQLKPSNITILDLSHNDIDDIKPLKKFLSNKTEDNFITQVNHNSYEKKSDLKLSDDWSANHLMDLQLYFAKLDYTGEKNTIRMPEKVIFLGNHASGKSSSLNYLKNKRLKNSKTSTHVLDIEYILKSKETKDTKPMFQASCYDFGGQDFYHGIYRIFLHDASMAVLLINPDNNHNYLDNQNVDSRQKTIETHKTQYFDVRYWRGLLNYIQSGKQSTHDKLTLFAIQSHATKGISKSWATPALLEKPFLVNNVNNKHYQHRVELAGFYHLNLKDKVGENTTPIDLKSFYERFTGHLNNTQNSFLLPQQEIDYLYDLMERANDTKKPKNSKEKRKENDYQPTTFNELKNKLCYLFKNNNYSLLQTQIRQYHRSGMVLYDERLQINQSDDIAKHIFWENPQGLVSFIHNELLSAEQINNGGIVAKDDFDKIMTTNLANKSLKNNQESIIELLKLHQVIFEHKFRNKIEYIIPNYLPLSAENNDYKLVNYSLGEPTFCLAFTDFIPVGMINQFITMFGCQTDDKLFWRDAMMFTLSNSLNDKEKLFRVHLHIDMQKLMISVYVVDLIKQGTKQIISYLYYCLMNAYWNYLTNLRPVNYKLFNQVTTFARQEIQDDADKEPQEYEFIHQLFDADNCYIPEDMYISRNGDKFVKYVDIINTDNPMIPYYEINNNQRNTSQNLSQSIDMERMIDCKKTISVEDFQHFTSKPLKRTARIFISYSHLDRTYKEDLFTHLVMLRRQGHHIFDDTQIGVGEFDEEIQKELREADIVLFLLSANFFNSEYIFHKEMTKVIETNLQNNRKQIVMPILIKYFDYHALAEITNGGFTDNDLRNFLDGHKNHFESIEKNISAMNEIGKNLFLPYYKGTNGTGKLLPIQGWEKDERDNAYAQIAQIVRKQVDNLPIQNFNPIRNINNDKQDTGINKTVRIFISYSHLDREYKDELMVYLKVLSRQGYHIFDGAKFVAGEAFGSRIQQELEQADIIVLMMSGNFFSSKYARKELNKILANNKSGVKKKVVIPVLVKEFDFNNLNHLVVDGAFTKDNLTTFKAVANKSHKVDLATDSNDHYKAMLKDCGDYHFLPYYRDDYKGIGKIMPIQLWDENERDSAYTQISQVVREAIKQL